MMPRFSIVTGRDFGRANAWSRARGNPAQQLIRARLTGWATHNEAVKGSTMKTIN